MNKRRRLFIIVGCVALCVMPVVAIYFISKTNTGAPAGAAPPPTAVPVATGPVVVTTAPLVAQTQLSAANIAVVQRPVDGLPPAGTYFATLEDLTSSPHFAVVSLAANTVVQPDMLATSSDQAKSAAVRAPLVQVAAGDVAVSIPFDEMKGAGGYVQPGDRLDILVDVNGANTVRYAFEDVLVLKVGSSSQQGQPGAASLLLVEVSRARAEELTFLMNAKGAGAPAIVRYVLRSHSDYGKGDLPTGSYTGPSQPDPGMSPDEFARLFGH